MSIDPIRTLDPAVGLVSEATVYPPNETGLWRTVAVLANSGSSREGFASAVGAFDVRRRDSLIRGAGEAVERFALVPTSADAAHLLAQDDAERRIDFVTGGLGCASALAYDLPWYKAVDLLSGKESHVPGPLVDYRPVVDRQADTPGPDPWERFFDASPNGAASGPTEKFAQRAGLAEVMERDAFLTAWHTSAPLHRVDIDELPESPKAHNLAALMEAARAAEVLYTLAFVPSAGSPLLTAVCVITDSTEPAPFGAVGLKASPDPVAALLGALQEGLQIRELFLSREAQAFDIGSSVTDDSSRADFWSTAPAVAGLQDWVATFPAVPTPASQPVPDVDDLANCLARRGIGCHWVDLTHRLPSAIRELGWVSGKAICPGAVQLTMDETKGLSFQRPGFSFVNQTPHPLI